MASGSGPFALPLSVLHARPSASADAARMAMIQKELAMTPRERMILALSLGLGERNDDLTPLGVTSDRSE